MMKSAFVTSSVSRNAGGLFFAMTRLAGSLSSLDYNTIVHGVSDAYSLDDNSAWHPVECHAHPRRGPAALAISPALDKALIQGDFDIVHTHGLWQWPSAATHGWHRRTGRPYLVSPHGMLDPWAIANSKWKKRIAGLWYETAHLRDAACLHALCQAEAGAFRSYGLKNPICVIPNGVDLPEIGDRRSETGDQRKTLLFLGRLHPKKGLVNALRAWKGISDQRSEAGGQGEWRFVIAGWDQGGHRAELEQLCRDIGFSVAGVSVEEFLAGVLHDPRAPLGKPAPGIDTPLQATSVRNESVMPSPTSDLRPLISDSCPLPSVIFTGPAFGQAKDALLRSASAFILPSFSEGLPMSVLEAWAYQLPVLMTDHCNLPEGFASDAAIRIGTDAESIAAGMTDLIRSSTSDLRSLGLNGRALVERQFTWPQVAAQMKEVYEWVLGGGARPRCVVD